MTAWRSFYGIAQGRLFCFKSDMKSWYCSFFSDIGELVFHAEIVFATGS